MYISNRMQWNYSLASPKRNSVSGHMTDQFFLEKCEDSWSLDVTAHAQSSCLTAHTDDHIADNHSLCWPYVTVTLCDFTPGLQIYDVAFPDPKTTVKSDV